MIEPFLKAVGGKRRVAEDLATEINRLEPKLYVEPFAGGGAVALALPPSLPKLLADMNPAFVTVWTVLRDQPAERLLDELEALRKAYDNSALGYAKARDELNEHLLNPGTPSVRFAALTLHINVRCFNGLWRVNSDGLFNTPWGGTRKVRQFTLHELRIYQEILRNVEISCTDFRRTFDSLLKRPRAERPNIVIYADPPYDGMFSDYTTAGFDDRDQADLAKWCGHVASLGMRVLTTNADTPLIRSLYAPWAKISTLNEQHSVGAKPAARGRRGCLLIKSF